MPNLLSFNIKLQIAYNLLDLIKYIQTFIVFAFHPWALLVCAVLTSLAVEKKVVSVVILICLTAVLSISKCIWICRWTAFDSYITVDVK